MEIFMVTLDHRLLLTARSLLDASNVHRLKEMIFACEQAVDLHTTVTGAGMRFTARPVSDAFVDTCSLPSCLSKPRRNSYQWGDLCWRVRCQPQRIDGPWLDALQLLAGCIKRRYTFIG